MSVINQIKKGDAVYDIQDQNAIANPSTKSDGQILAYDATNGAWVAANAAASGVQSVTANGNSITIGGTAADPTVAAKISAVANNGLSVKSDGLYAAATDLSEVEGRLDTIEGKESDWDAKLDATDITTGSANGTIAANGTDVAVKGLGSAAYTASSAYATSAQGTKADSALQSHQTVTLSTGTANGTVKITTAAGTGDDIAVKGLGSAAYTDSTDYLGASETATNSSKLENHAASYFATDSDMTSAEGRLDTIEEKIPTGTTSSNQLVNADQMGDAIAAVEAKQLYKTNAQGSFATKAELTAAVTFYDAAGTAATPTKNDVAYVLADEDHDGKSTKYVIASITGSTPVWGFVIAFTDTTFTQAQMNAINSGMSSADKTKLDGVAENANNYVHPAGSAASQASGLYKFSTDATSHISGVTAVAKSDITALGIPDADTHYTNAFNIQGNGTAATSFTQDAAKTLNIKGGSNVTVTAATDEITIAATDTVTTVTETGSGNAITALSASNGAITATKGATFLTSHQDISGKQDALTTATCTLTTSMTIAGQTVSVSGVTASNIVFIAPAPASTSVYAAAGIYCSAQGAGTLTFMATKAPTADVTVNVVIAD